jgi:hypothetical protein
MRPRGDPCAVPAGRGVPHQDRPVVLAERCARLARVDGSFPHDDAPLAKVDASFARKDAPMTKRDRPYARVDGPIDTESRGLSRIWTKISKIDALDRSDRDPVGFTR